MANEGLEKLSATFLCGRIINADFRVVAACGKETVRLNAESNCMNLLKKLQSVIIYASYGTREFQGARVSYFVSVILKNISRSTRIEVPHYDNFVHGTRRQNLQVLCSSK